MSAAPNLAFPASTRSLLNVRTPPRIRLDRAQRFSITQGASVGLFSQIFLFNQSKQNYHLVVRGITWGPSASGPINLGMFKGVVGNLSTNMNQPVWPDAGLLPGQAYSQPGGSVITPDTVLYLQSLEQTYSGEYPVIVAPPGWSVAMSPQVVNVALTASFVWEALTPDEFTEMYGEYIP